MAGSAKANYEYEKRKQELRIADLKRYHIRALLVDDYDEITEILRELNRRCHLKDIFVSGSAAEYGKKGRDRIEDLARKVGQQIIKKGYNLISGFGLSIGGAVIVGAMEAVYEDGLASMDGRMTLRPFPQRQRPKGMTQVQFWKKYREDMIDRAGFVVFLCGNKIDPKTGKIVLADGVVEEFEIAKQLGKYPISIGATGYAAEEIWQGVSGSLQDFYPGVAVKECFQILGDPKKSDDEIIQAIFAVIERVTRPQMHKKKSHHHK